jgi:hypothetical protein
MDFTEFMDDLRKRALDGATVLELAAKLDIDYHRLCYFFRCKGSKPAVDILDKLTNHLGYRIVRHDPIAS